MASKIKVTRQKVEMLEKEGPETPLLDLSDAAVKALIRSAKKRGYVIHDQINALLSSEEVKSEQIEDNLGKFSEMGVNVVETEEAEPENEGAREEPDDEEESEGQLVEVKPKLPAKSGAKDPAGRTDDPVRIYLRSVDLLSREGEIAIAKRIEAGREVMIAGLCESPLTFQAVLIWRDELNDGKVLLRDIIDLEATYAGPDAKQMQVPVTIDPDGKPIAQAAVPGAIPVPGAPHLQIVQPVAPPAAPPAAIPFRALDEPAAEGEEKDPAEAAAESDYDEDDMDNSLSLARSKPNSSRKWSRPLTTSPTHSSGCAVCSSRTSSSA
jgi:RNA polymerase primary sigma factor